MGDPAIPDFALEYNGIPLFLLPPELVPFAQEEARRTLARRHLSHYARYVVGVTPALHHMLICDAIDAMMGSDDPADPAAALGDCDELIILAPPGSAKSTYTSVAFAAYFLGRWPQRHILTASYSTELAEKWGRKVRGIVDSPAHNIVFPHSRLSKDSTAAGRWATSLGGEFYAAGVGSGILGFRADLGLIDDPISGFEQAQSMTQLAKMHEWYENDFVTRLKPNAKVVLICQRLARNDLAGYLIDRNAENPTRRQRILKLPMEADPTPDCPDPLNRQPGDRLWPEWFTAEMVADAKRDDYKWRTLYQQEPPSDTGSWVASSEIEIIEPMLVPPAHELVHYMMTDLALSINSGDYSVHIVAGIDNNGVAYLVDAWRERASPDKTAVKHLALAATYKPVESLIDDDNAAKVYVQLLASQARSSRQSVNWKMLPMRGQDKETRAAALRGMFKRGLIRLVRAEWNRWLVKELLTFPNATGSGVDDGVDALSLLGRRLASLARAAPPAAPAKPLKTIHEATLNELWDTAPVRSTRI